MLPQWVSDGPTDKLTAFVGNGMEEHVTMLKLLVVQLTHFSIVDSKESTKKPVKSQQKTPKESQYEFNCLANLL